HRKTAHSTPPASASPPADRQSLPVSRRRDTALPFVDPAAASPPDRTPLAQTRAAPAPPNSRIHPRPANAANSAAQPIRVARNAAAPPPLADPYSPKRGSPEPVPAALPCASTPRAFSKRADLSAQ